MKRVLLAIAVCSLFLCFSVADIHVLKFFILNKLSEYSSENYPEKLYIQTDKPYYVAGENIWFNTFLVNGATHKKSLKSKVIYIELINEKDSIVNEVKLYTESISAHGDFKLPVDLKEGNYLLRAYTNYMRNQENDYFFKKKIPVYAFNSGIIESIGDSLNVSENGEFPEIGFYPEGGYLVEGIITKVALKVKDADLDANPISGYIEDTQGNKITDFTTREFGLGSFSLKPEPGKQYQAVITSGEEDVLYPLPEALSEGYVMSTSISEKDILINITTNKEQGLKNTLLIGHQRGLATFDYIHDNDNKSVLLKIPKIDLTEGILNIVLFNESEQPVAERLVFVKKEEEVLVSIKKINNSSISVRERVNLKVEVNDKFGKIIPSTLSLSVTDAELIKPDSNSENIKTWLLLNSDLRGKIKSPNYFFQNGDNIKKNELLDLIMMTHGWRRFTWQKLLNESSMQAFKPEDGIYISGHTISSQTPFKSKLSETKITFRKEGFIQEAQNTNEDGYFSYGPYLFINEVGVFLQAGEDLSSNNPNYFDTNIKLNPINNKPDIMPKQSVAATPYKQEARALKAYKEKSKKNVSANFEFEDGREILDEVNIKTTKITKEELDNIERKRRTRGNFEPSYRIIVDDMGIRGSDDFLSLIANIPGIRIGRRYDAETSQDIIVTLRGPEPEYFLDGVKVDLPIMRSIPQANIDFIDIRNSGHASANYALAATGVIAIYTRKGNRSSDISKITNRKAGSISFQLEGFYSAREFYAPDYSLEGRNSKREDRRTTLYWQPNISVNDSSATVHFYTSDDKGRFQIEVEGVTETGIPVHATALLEVE